MHEQKLFKKLQISPYKLFLFARKNNPQLLLLLTIRKISYFIGYRYINLKGEVGYVLKLAAQKNLHYPLKLVEASKFN